MRRSIVIWLACACAACAAEKKFIGHGWDLLAVSPAEVLAHAEAFDKTALDGVTLCLKKVLPDGRHLAYSTIMNDPEWTEEAFADQIPIFRQIVSHPSLRESFLACFCAPNKRLAWQDDAAWARAVNNLAVLAGLAKKGGLRGVLIDHEDYPNSRQFFRIPTDPPFAETARLARQRGAQLMTAMTKSYPDMTFLSFWFLSMNRSLMDSDDPMAAAENASDVWPAFFNGMLDALPPTARLVDGDEHAYRYEASRNDFFVSAWYQRQGALKLVAPENWKKYREQVLTGFGLYLDVYINKEGDPWYFGPVNGSRLNHFEANVRQAAKVASEYVWVYGEKSPWIAWSGIGATKYEGKPSWEECLPGLAEAMVGAKDPKALLAMRLAALRTAGAMTNLAVTVTAPADAPLPPDGFRPDGLPRPWFCWQDENFAQGVFGIDGKVGDGDTSSLCMKGVGHGCFGFPLDGVKPGESYVVRFSAKGTVPTTANASWQKDGVWQWQIPSATLFLPPARTAEEWRRSESLVRIPEGVNRMVILLGAKQGPDDKTWFDDLQIYRCR
ncbi:MAG: hypothetical protein J6336_07535 [Kiritimatiellae bacterium]|nr:hypothetical protein [Kiritimatiellia bacterium]